MSIDDRLSLVAEKKPLAALIWPWILTAFDDWGRAETSARQLKNKVFPAISMVTAKDIEEALVLYGQVGLITLYEVEGKRYMCIEPLKWFKYQTHIRMSKREKDDSRIPAPRTCAQPRADARICTPSPSPSPSLSQRDITNKADPATIPAVEGEWVPCFKREDWHKRLAASFKTAMERDLTDEEASALIDLLENTYCHPVYKNEGCGMPLDCSRLWALAFDKLKAARERDGKVGSPIGLLKRILKEALSDCGHRPGRA
jgi:hypothetical protein